MPLFTPQTEWIPPEEFPDLSKYKEIKPRQFWHNPNGTRTEYYNLSEILLSLRNAGYSLLDGYSFFFESKT